MTAFELACLKVARTVMTPEELASAKALAVKADAGDLGARGALRAAVGAVLAERKRFSPFAKKK